jgi:hypothetical protein
MAKSDRTALETAIGKLILAIQKEWQEEMGEPTAVESEKIMHLCHDLLQASKCGTIVGVLNNLTITEFIGEDWIKKHPLVIPHIRSLELAK